jgi:hypothetical protein
LSSAPNPPPLPVPVELIGDLADLYQAPTRAFNQTVKRNLDRFPDDFMFQLNEEEASLLRSQSVTSSWGGRRYLPGFSTSTFMIPNRRSLPRPHILWQTVGLEMSS